MARDIDFEERRRRREEEDERETESQGRRPGAKGYGSSAKGDVPLDARGEKIEELMERADPLIEQVNSLYNQYLVGVERMAPIERRKHLDQLMESLQLMGKSSPAMQFRFSNLFQKYQTFRDRWDRMCKDLESGKLKRVTGPRRAG